jgi:hypothetical protein
MGGHIDRLFARFVESSGMGVAALFWSGIHTATTIWPEE